MNKQETSQITVAQINLMKHCIGYETAIHEGMITGTKHRKYKAFRNHFVEHTKNIEFEKLLELGIINLHVGNHLTYYLNEKGFEFMSELLGVTITEMR